jgi:hypothetical protein
MGLYCYQCHNWRNKFSAAIREKEDNRIVGYLCKKCAIKNVQTVKDRPFGMGWWRLAFKLKDNPQAIQVWKDQRLEMEIKK